MRRPGNIATIGLALALVGILTATVAEARGKKKRGGKEAAAAAVPDHPSKLQYGALNFEVPDAASYRHELENGIPVFVAEDHSLPLVSISITLRAGGFLDPDDKPGTAEMTGSMMRRGGTEAMTPEQFDERADFLAADVSSFTADLEGGASLNCITGVLDETLELFFDMIRSPRFDPKRLQVEKDNVLEGMKQRNDSPASISGREWGWLMRGRDFFTARTLTEAELGAISRGDLQTFHRRYWRPENMIIAVSGDVTTEDILGKLEKRFEGWNVEGPDVPWPPPPPDHTPAPGVYYVQKDIPQGRTLIGHLGVTRSSWDDPEPFALAIMNNVLGGGGFTSRLVKRIRSDEGLAYSAGSSFGVGEFWPGIFQMFYQSKSETVAFAAQIALQEVERMRTELVSAEELTVAKNSYIDVFPRRFESAAQIANTFAEDEYEGRPHEYWKTYRDRMRAVTAEDVRKVAVEHLHSDRLVFLVIGDWEEIKAGDPDGRASMKEFFDGESTRLPLRDPLTLEPLPED